MGNNKSLYKREAYTLLSLLGDFGGFTDALSLILGTLTSIYSAKMYQAAIASELPAESVNSRRFFHASSEATREDYRQLCRSINLGNQLSRSDLSLIHKAISWTSQRLKAPSFYKQLCWVGLLCRKDKRVRMQRQLSGVFEASLDVKKRVEDHFKLRLLIDMLLTREQKFLFDNNHTRADCLGGEQLPVMKKPRVTQSRN